MLFRSNTFFEFVLQYHGVQGKVNSLFSKVTVKNMIEFHLPGRMGEFGNSKFCTIDLLPAKKSHGGINGRQLVVEIILQNVISWKFLMNDRIRSNKFAGPGDAANLFVERKP